MITLTQYWMGRDIRFKGELTSQIAANATDTVSRINKLLAYAAEDGVEPGIDPSTNTPVSSGWRPEGVNASTSNAGTHSKHITADAGDIRDTPERSFARWCLSNLDKLEECGLWMEDPRWTPHWVHLQRLPPGSGKRVYVPSTKPPLCEALPEQKGS